MNLIASVRREENPPGIVQNEEVHGVRRSGEVHRRAYDAALWGEGFRDCGGERENLRNRNREISFSDAQDLSQLTPSAPSPSWAGGAYNSEPRKGKDGRKGKTEEKQ